MRLQQAGHGGGAGRLGEVPLRGRTRRQSGERHGLPVAAVPGSGHLGVQRSADRDHPGPPACEQVVGGVPRAADVVDVHVPARFDIHRAPAEDDRQRALLGEPGQRVVLVRRRQHHPVDGARAHELLDPPPAAGGGGHAQHHVQVGFLQSAGHPRDDLGEERVRQNLRVVPRDDQRGRTRLTRGQGPRLRVGDVAELPDRLLHGFALGPTDMGSVVDHPGGHRPRHTGQRGHLVERGVPVRQLLGHGHGPSLAAGMEAPIVTGGRCGRAAGPGPFPGGSAACSDHPYDGS